MHGFLSPGPSIWDQRWKVHLWKQCHCLLWYVNMFDHKVASFLSSEQTSYLGLEANESSSLSPLGEIEGTGVCDCFFNAANPHDAGNWCQGLLNRWLVNGRSLAWLDQQHVFTQKLKKQPQVYTQNDVWGMTTEIPCFWWDEIRSTSQIRLLMRHQCEISALAPPMSFCRKTSGGFAKYKLFSQAKEMLVFAP